jgi:hypothetical protein
MQNSVKHLPLMPKSTAVWLVENTALTFRQIADFCGMHELEVQGIADGDVAKGIVGMDPISAGQLTSSEIDRCTNDPNKKLVLNSIQADLITSKAKVKKGKKVKYTPIARRRDKPDAIFWLLKNYPDISNGQVVKLIGATKNTVEAIRLRTYWNINELRPKDPVVLGLFSQKEIDNIKIMPKILSESTDEQAEPAN